MFLQAKMIKTKGLCQMKQVTKKTQIKARKHTRDNLQQYRSLRHHCRGSSEKVERITNVIQMIEKGGKNDFVKELH